MGIPMALPREKSGLWLTKDNRLVSMHANMTAITYKLTNYFLWRAQQEGKLTGLSVDCRKIVEDCRIKATNFSDVLLSECKKVALTQISVMEEKGNWAVRQVIPNMTYRDGVLTADINPKIAPYIYDLKRSFTRGDLLQSNKCDTYAAIRMYETCNSWARKGCACYSVDEWRSLLGGEGEAYGRFSNFNQKIIKPAVRIVNENTDLEIRVEYVKSGRKVTHMKVHISKKDGLPGAEWQEGQEEAPAATGGGADYIPLPGKRASHALEERDVVRKMVGEYKQTKKNAEEYVRKYGIEYCQEQMEYVRQENRKKPIKRIGGYFRKAMEEDYAGSRRATVAAAKAEEEENEDVAAWNREARGISASHGKGSDASEASLEQGVLAAHPEAAMVCRSMGIPDGRIARWLEKYPDALLLGLAFKLKGEAGITADYMESCLREAAGRRKPTP